MNLTDIELLCAKRNDGEQFLIEVLVALRDNPNAKAELVEKLETAVTAMVAEDDPAMRLNALTHKLGLANREGRPPIEKNIKKQEQGWRMARAYWWYWLQGCKKGEAARKVAEKNQSSGEFQEGYPSPDTVQKNVKRYPQQAKYAFYYWRLLFQPSKDEKERAFDEIKRHLKKNR